MGLRGSRVTDLRSRDVKEEGFDKVQKWSSKFDAISRNVVAYR